MAELVRAVDIPEADAVLLGHDVDGGAGVLVRSRSVKRHGIDDVTSGQPTSSTLCLRVPATHTCEILGTVSRELLGGSTASRIPRT